MQGKHQIQIAGDQFAGGLATSDYLGDGGIGTGSQNLSLSATPGVVRASKATTATGDPLTTYFVASAEDPRSTDSTNAKRIYIDSSGQLFSTDGAAISIRKLLVGTTGWVTEVSDMVSFAGDLYATKTSDVVKITVPSDITTSWTADESYWVGTKGQTSLNTSAVHPLLIYQNFLWIGDANKLHTISSSGTAAAAVLTLDSNERVQCLGVDPGTGLMLIGVNASYVVNDATSFRSYIYQYDGYSSKPRRKIPIEGMINSIYVSGGSVYVTVDNVVNVWNGNGLTFLRRLTNIPPVSTYLPSKARITSCQDTLLVADGNQILAYGNVANGKKVWYPVYTGPTAPDLVFHISYIGNNTNVSGYTSPIISVNYGLTKLTFLEPLSTASTGTGILYGTKINLERPINMFEMEVFTTGITTTAGIGEIALIDEEGNTVKPTVSSFVVGTGTIQRFQFNFGGRKFRSLQPKITMGTQSFGIIRLVMYYDVAE